MKVYDIVKQILERSENARNSDKSLIFQFWHDKGYLHKCAETNEWSITYSNFKKSVSVETLRRSRQKVQELHPELQPTIASVRKARGIKEDTKGTFIYREEA